MNMLRICNENATLMHIFLIHEKNQCFAYTPNYFLLEPIGFAYSFNHFLVGVTQFWGDPVNSLTFTILTITIDIQIICSNPQYCSRKQSF